MCRCVTRLVLVLCVSTPALAQPVVLHEQFDRRDRREPAIILNSGGRTGTADVVKFTPDGRFLLAAGDDKQVAVYPIREQGLDSIRVDFLRWPTWREQRGSIYAMAISPDGKFVAVGGLGMLDSAVAVIDRETKKIVHFADLRRGEENLYAVMSLAFSPDGTQLAAGTGSGAVCVWNFRDPPEVVGRHKNDEGTFNRVRAIWFETNDKIHSVAETAKAAGRTRALLELAGAPAVRLGDRWSERLVEQRRARAWRRRRASGRRQRTSRRSPAAVLAVEAEQQRRDRARIAFQRTPATTQSAVRAP